MRERCERRREKEARSGPHVSTAAKGREEVREGERRGERGQGKARGSKVREAFRSFTWVFQHHVGRSLLTKHANERCFAVGDERRIGVDGAQHRATHLREGYGRPWKV